MKTKVKTATPSTLEALRFDHSFTEQLPADPVTDNHLRQVKEACYSWVQPQAFPDASLIAYSPEMAHILDLSDDTCRSQRFVEVFSGTHLLEDMKPHAQCYGGHQFGNWAGQLGDGRAINLGDVINGEGQ
ncbi:MAG: protein adenylyltransferase SelO family protein, partial [Natronospirillum sp.]